MTDRDEAVKILGQAGFRVRRIGLRMYVVERRCSSAQLVKMAATAVNGLGNASLETMDQDGPQT